MKFVSNTLSNPILFRAELSSPVNDFPGATPNSSPIAALGEGAVWITTCLFGLSIASHISSDGSFVERAAVGHLFVHCPQLIQITSASGLSRKVPICVLSPLSIASRTPTSCRSIHVLIHLLQRIHLFKSLITETDDLSTEYLGCST